MPSITIFCEMQDVGRAQRHGRKAAPKAHGNFRFFVPHRALDAGFGGSDRRQLRPCRVGLPDVGRSARPSGAVSSAPARTTTMAIQHPAIDRRALITGRLRNPDRVVAPPGGEIASILVQARPERLLEVEAAITALAGCEIYGRDPKGKLVVVVDAADAGLVGTTLNTIALLADVYSASLVFHAIDAG